MVGNVLAFSCINGRCSCIARTKAGGHHHHGMLHTTRTNSSNLVVDKYTEGQQLLQGDDHVLSRWNPTREVKDHRDRRAVPIF